MAQLLKEPYPFSVLLILLDTKAFLTRLLCWGQLAPEIAHITQIIMAVLILWASSIQWPLLAWRTKRAVYLRYAQSPGLCPVIFRGIYYRRGHRWFTLEKLFLPCHHMGCPCLIPIGSSRALAELDHKYMWSNNAILGKHGLERCLKWRLAQPVASCVHDGICKLPSSLTLSEQQSHTQGCDKGKPALRWGRGCLNSGCVWVPALRATWSLTSFSPCRWCLKRGKLNHLLN